MAENELESLVVASKNGDCLCVTLAERERRDLKGKVCNDPNISHIGSVIERSFVYIYRCKESKFQLGLAIS